MEDTMRYALLIYGEPGGGESAPPAPEGVMDSWVDYTAAVRDAGGLHGAEQLQLPDTATTVTVRPTGERLFTDGPFVETKEHLLGFYLVEADDLDTALDWAARMPVMRYGAVEVRPVHEGRPWQRVLD
jgi:hypothetical protein